MLRKDSSSNGTHACHVHIEIMNHTCTRTINTERASRFMMPLASIQGGAVYVRDTAEVTFGNCEFNDNSAVSYNPI